MKSNIVIEPDALANRLLSSDNILIIDLGNTQRYRQGHIAGAVHVCPQQLISGLAPATGKLPPLYALETLFSELGYTGKDQHFIVYDDEGGGWAGRFIWTLDVIGHINYSYLNGGLHSWIKEGLPLERAAESYNNINSTESLKVKLTVNRNVIASREYIAARLSSSDTVLWDARSPEEFCGERRFAMRAGHIPGAVNYEWLRGMDPENGYRIRKGIEDELIACGIIKDKEIITYCQSHHRSGFTYMVAKVLGYKKIRAYDGSWSEWGNLLDTPIEV